MNEKPNSETILIELSFPDAFLLFRCVVSINTFLMYINDSIDRNYDYSMINNLRNTLKNAINAKPMQMDSSSKDEEILKFYEAQMRRKR